MRGRGGDGFEMRAKKLQYINLCWGGKEGDRFFVRRRTSISFPGRLCTYSCVGVGCLKATPSPSVSPTPFAFSLCDYKGFPFPPYTSFFQRCRLVPPPVPSLPPLPLPFSSLIEIWLREGKGGKSHMSPSRGGVEKGKWKSLVWDGGHRGVGD